MHLYMFDIYIYMYTYIYTHTYQIHTKAYINTYIHTSAPCDNVISSTNTLHISTCMISITHIHAHSINMIFKYIIFTKPAYTNIHKRAQCDTAIISNGIIHTSTRITYLWYWYINLKFTQHANTNANMKKKKTFPGRTGGKTKKAHSQYAKKRGKVRTCSRPGN